MRRGLAIAEVAADTRINPAYLEAMEAERWELLPAPVYARGFFRSYARYLRLDDAVIERLVPSHLPRPRELEPAPGLRRTAEPAIALPSFDWLRGLGNRPSEVRRPPRGATPADRTTFSPPRTTSAATPGATSRTTTPPRAPRGAAPASMGAGWASALGGLRRQLGGLLAGVTAAAGRDPRTTAVGALLAVALLVAAGGYYWYGSREEPQTVAASPTVIRSQAAGPEPTSTATTSGAAAAPRSGEMPNLVGRTRREAEDELGRLGLAFVVIEVATPTAPPGTVYNQSPEPGKSIKRGDSVTLLVARAP